MTRVVVVRHGETDWNRNGRMQGWAPTPLNDLGREQATAAGEYLAAEYDVDRVVASDLERTRETALRLCEALPVDPAGERVGYDRAWRERDLGVYQGLAYEDMYDRFPAFGLGEAAAEAAARVPEGGESLLDLRARVLDGWAALLAAAGDAETVLVVTHGGPIHFLLGHVKGLDVREAFLEHSMANCGVTVLERPPDAPAAATADPVEVVVENSTAWETGEGR